MAPVFSWGVRGGAGKAEGGRWGGTSLTGQLVSENLVNGVGEEDP